MLGLVMIIFTYKITLAIKYDCYILSLFKTSPNHDKLKKIITLANIIFSQKDEKKNLIIIILTTRIIQFLIFLLYMHIPFLFIFKIISLKLFL